MHTWLCEKINQGNGRSPGEPSSNLAWFLRSKGRKDRSFIEEKGENRGDKGLSVKGCRAGTDMAGKLLISALRLLSLVWDMIGYCLHYSDGK